MTPEDIQTPMELYDELTLTRQGIGGALYGLETALNGPSLYWERAISLAALGERLMQEAER